MSRWTNEERAFTLEAYFANNRSFVAAQRAFRTHYGIKSRGKAPDRQSILLWVDNFRSSGCVEKKAPGPRRTVTTPENVEAVRQALLRSPARSARKHALALGISNRSMLRILHEHLHVHPESKQPKPQPAAAEESQSKAGNKLNASAKRRGKRQSKPVIPASADHQNLPDNSI